MEENQRTLKEAEFALKQAFAFCPYSPEAVFKYVSFLVSLGRAPEARQHPLLQRRQVPLLRRSAPSSIVNVASVAGRVSRARSGAYSASKFALIGWSDGLFGEERPNGVHVGLVLPGFVSTEGFPQRELMEKALTRRIVSSPEKVANAIVAAGPGGKAERYVPRPYWFAAAARIVVPRLVRRGASAGALTPSTKAGPGEPADP